METQKLTGSRLGDLNISSNILTSASAVELSIFTKLGELSNDISALVDSSLTLTLNKNTLTLNDGYRDLSVDMSEFAKDSYLSNVIYDKDEKKLKLFVKKADGTIQTIAIDASDFVKQYTADDVTISSSYDESTGKTTFGVKDEWMNSQITAAMAPICADHDNKAYISAVNQISSDLSTTFANDVSMKVSQLSTPDQISAALAQKMDVVSAYTKAEVNSISSDLSNATTAYVSAEIGKLSTNAQISAALDAKATITQAEILEATALSDISVEVDAAMAKKADLSDLTAHIGNAEIHVTTAEKEIWNDVSNLTAYQLSAKYTEMSASISTDLLDKLNGRITVVSGNISAVAKNISNVGDNLSAVSAYLSTHTHLLSDVTDFTSAWANSFGALSTIATSSSIDDVVGTLVQVVSKLQIAPSAT